MRRKANGQKVVFEEPQLPTRADWDAASPRMKGYMSYTFSAWPGSEIPARCPFTVGTPEYEQWCRGQDVAVQDAQDSEE